MAIAELPKTFQIVVGDTKETVEVLHGSPTIVGDGFEYDENGWGYGLKFHTHKPQTPQLLLNIYSSDESNYSPIKGSYTYWPWKNRQETIEGYYMLCDCQVEAFGKTITLKVILFFKSKGIIPFYLYHDIDETKTIQKFEEIRQKQSI